MDHSLCKDCNGYCCDDIGLDQPPHKLQNSYHKWKNGDTDIKEVSLSLTGKKTAKYEGIWLTYPMLEFTHQDNIHPDGDIHTKQSYVIYHYRCKHHNKKTKNCDIYEERPMMCRTFPNSGFCGYRKVKDKRVIASRPKWFKCGLSEHDWIAGYHNKILRKISL